MAGFEETGARALAKLEQVLPEKLRRRLKALRSATSAGPVNTDSNVEDPVVDAELLNELAAAIRDHQGLRCYYRDQPREIEPYHLVGWQRRWYLVGRDPATRRVGAVPRRLAAAAHSRRPPVRPDAASPAT